MRHRLALLAIALVGTGCASAPPSQTIVLERFDPPVKAVHVISAEYVPDQRQGAGLAQGGYDHVLQRRVARPVKEGADEGARR